MSKLVYRLVCVTCGNEFEGKKSDSKNCSKECRVKAGHIKRKQVNDEKLAQKLKQIQPKQCLNCNEMFIPYVSKQDTQVYCGSECQQKYLHKLRTEKPGYHEQRAAYKREWYSENIEEKRAINRFYAYKNRYDGNFIPALERDNYTCTECGETDREKLHVHHKDHSGKTYNPNHALDNLQTLCKHCHAKHHNSEENNIHKYRIPDEEVKQAIETTNTIIEASYKLGVHVSWVYGWRRDKWSLLKPKSCPVCKKEFPNRGQKTFCSHDCAYEHKMNLRRGK